MSPVGRCRSRKKIVHNWPRNMANSRKIRTEFALEHTEVIILTQRPTLDDLELGLNRRIDDDKLNGI